MKQFFTKILLCWILLALAAQVSAQTDRKVTFTGAARGMFFADHLRQESTTADTTTVPKLNSGNTLADLGIKIHPNKHTEILGMVRIRNDYGGFWGSGVTFDVRQLSVKGVIGGVFRYQLGDINYRMSRYTLWNYDQEVVSGNAAIFRQQTEILNYDHFYFDDFSRRQQGAAGEFALVFKKYIQELQVHMMTSRVAASNFSSASDRLFTGLNAQLVQSKYLTLGVNYASMYDVPGTARTRTTFHNPVITGTWTAQWESARTLIQTTGETGNSKTFYKGMEDAPRFNGGITDGQLLWRDKKWGVFAAITAKRVDAGFRSPGAQTKRIDFAGAPAAFTRITNEQVRRPFSMLDLMRESDFYTLQLRPSLMQFSPIYDNITPYGDATPNRQGWILQAGWEKKNHPVKLEVTHMQLQEVKGEGTLNLRQFSRQLVRAEVAVNKWFKNWKKDMRITAQYRNDKTTRSAEELVRGVDLRTQMASFGLELEMLEDFDLLLGQQYIHYNGFDYTAVRDEYSVIFNFTEYKASGRESMRAAGLRYRFNENNSLTANLTEYVNRNTGGSVPNYHIIQFMMLYSMKF